MAAGRLFTKARHRHRVVIGKDTRLSGYMIEPALVAGFTAVGMDVFLFGPLPTPAVAMLTRSLRADLGVMISASHNPYQRQRHQAVRPRRLQALRRRRGTADRAPDGQATCADLLAESDEARPRQAHRRRARALHRIRQAHASRRTCASTASRIVIDCANGAAYKVAPEALWELGAEVIAIGVEPNGFNINQECGSTAPDA